MNYFNNNDLIDRRRHFALGKKSLQLEDVKVGHTNALHLPWGLESLHPLWEHKQTHTHTHNERSLSNKDLYFNYIIVLDLLLSKAPVRIGWSNFRSSIVSIAMLLQADAAGTQTWSTEQFLTQPSCLPPLSSSPFIFFSLGISMCPVPPAVSYAIFP